MTDRFHVTERGKLKKQVHDLTTELDGQKEVRAEMLAVLKKCLRDELRRRADLRKASTAACYADSRIEQIRAAIAKAEAGE